MDILLGADGKTRGKDDTRYEDTLHGSDTVDSVSSIREAPGLSAKRWLPSAGHPPPFLIIPSIGPFGQREQTGNPYRYVMAVSKDSIRSTQIMLPSVRR